MQISPGYEQKAVLTKAHTATNGALTDGGGVAAADAHYAVGDLVQICADMERIKGMQKGHGNRQSATTGLEVHTGRSTADCVDVDPGGDFAVQ